MLKQLLPDEKLALKNGGSNEELSSLAWRFNNLNSTAKMLLLGSDAKSLPFIAISELAKAIPEKAPIAPDMAPQTQTPVRYPLQFSYPASAPALRPPENIYSAAPQITEEQLVEPVGFEEQTAPTPVWSYQRESYGQQLETPKSNSLVKRSIAPIAIVSGIILASVVGYYAINLFNSKASTQNTANDPFRTQEQTFPTSSSEELSDESLLSTEQEEQPKYAAPSTAKTADISQLKRPKLTRPQVVQAPEVAAKPAKRPAIDPSILYRTEKGLATNSTLEASNFPLETGLLVDEILDSKLTSPSNSVVNPALLQQIKERAGLLNQPVNPSQETFTEATQPFFQSPYSAQKQLIQPVFGSVQKLEAPVQSPKQASEQATDLWADSKPSKLSREELWGKKVVVSSSAQEEVQRAEPASQKAEKAAAGLWDDENSKIRGGKDLWAKPTTGKLAQMPQATTIEQSALKLPAQKPQAKANSNLWTGGNSSQAKNSALWANPTVQKAQQVEASKPKQEQEQVQINQNAWEAETQNTALWNGGTPSQAKNSALWTNPNVQKAQPLEASKPKQQQEQVQINQNAWEAETQNTALWNSTNPSQANNSALWTNPTVQKAQQIEASKPKQQQEQIKQNSWEAAPTEAKIQANPKVWDLSAFTQKAKQAPSPTKPNLDLAKQFGMKLRAPQASSMNYMKPDTSAWLDARMPAPKSQITPTAFKKDEDPVQTSGLKPEAPKLRNPYESFALPPEGSVFNSPYSAPSTKGLQSKMPYVGERNLDEMDNILRLSLLELKLSNHLSASFANGQESPSEKLVEDFEYLRSRFQSKNETSLG